jgi:hypothetical protein
LNSNIGKSIPRCVNSRKASGRFLTAALGFLTPAQRFLMVTLTFLTAARRFLTITLAFLTAARRFLKVAEEFLTVTLAFLKITMCFLKVEEGQSGCWIRFRLASAGKVYFKMRSV